MLVASSRQTTSIISLKRSTSTQSRVCDSRPNIPSDAISMMFTAAQVAPINLA
jgi:hypothetical protein